MEALEIGAKNVDEAIEVALDQLGLTRSEVTIEVLQEGKRSIWGMGGEDAIVKVTPLESSQTPGSDTSTTVDPETATDTAREILEQLLSLMEIEGSIEIIPSDEEAKMPATLAIANDNPGILIGRRGQALSALQYMVNFLSSRKLKSGVKVMVDVADYRKRRREELENMALRIADLVRTNQRSITMEPMGAWERRIVHLTLREEAGVITGSVGYGERRKVVVSLKK